MDDAKMEERVQEALSQAKAPTVQERASDFVKAVLEGDRVSVSTVNALGGWDTCHFSRTEVLHAINKETSND